MAQQANNFEDKASSKLCSFRFPTPSSSFSSFYSLLNGSALICSSSIHHLYKVIMSTREDETIGLLSTACTQESPSTIEVQPNQVQDDQNLDVTGCKTKNKRTPSAVWDHFQRKKIEGKPKAICNYCNKALVGAPTDGTTHLHEHLRRCPRRGQVDIGQSILNLKRKADGKITLGGYTFDQESAKNALARMIVMHEYPISIVEHIGFRLFCNAIQPLFQNVSRYLIKKEIFKVYEDEKSKTMDLLKSNRSRIAITTDMWTTKNQKRGFMVVTSHFIDDSWILQSRVVRFIYVPCPHTAERLCDALMKCLMEWKIDKKLSTLTADNCSTNDAMITLLFEKLNCNELLLGGELFHVRCSAHILNLIVKDGLEKICGSIERVRDSVAYWTATPKREDKFVEIAQRINIPSTKKLILDCKTRWNSTYLMLHTALVYKDVFPRLKRLDTQYKSLPENADWDLAAEICERLELFYEVNELFSGTKYPTVNMFFPKICEIRASISEWQQSEYIDIQLMATDMITKFEQYWSKIHGIMAVGNILDPRFKMKWVEFYFKQIYKRQAPKEVEKIRKLCLDLLKEYELSAKSGKEPSLRTDMSNETSSQSQGTFGKKGRLLNEFELFVSSTCNLHLAKSELDYYLEEGLLPRTSEFDILAWWKTNGIKYPTLLAIARDILAIPVTTVASESAFSTSGRFVSPHRSKLLPKTLEVLMCSHNWLWANIKAPTTQCGNGTNNDDVDVDEDNQNDEEESSLENSS